MHVFDVYYDGLALVECVRHIDLALSHMRLLLLRHGRHGLGLVAVTGAGACFCGFIRTNQILLIDDFISNIYQKKNQTCKTNGFVRINCTFGKFCTDALNGGGLNGGRRGCRGRRQQISCWGEPSFHLFPNHKFKKINAIRFLSSIKKSKFLKNTV